MSAPLTEKTAIKTAVSAANGGFTADPVEDEPETPDSDTGTTGNGLAQYDENGYCTVLTNGKPATAKNVTELIESLRDKYPEGATSPDCAGSAQLISADIFGEDWQIDFKQKKNGDIMPNLEELRPGDQFDYRSDDTGGHTVVVVRKAYTKNENGDIVFAGVTVAEGSYNGAYHWDRLIRADDVESGNVEIYGYAKALY